MRILLDLLHPAQVHFFRNFYREMDRRGHELLITARSKEVTLPLLRQYGMPYRHISNQRSGRAGLVIELAGRTSRLLGIAREFRPHVMTGIMGPSIAPAGRLLRIPTVVFYDMEAAWRTNWFVYPLAHIVCTPDSYTGKVIGRHVTYPGYHQLAYLHPRRFEPDRVRVEAYGVDPGKPYSVVRFVSWQASHDIGEAHLGSTGKNRLVKHLLQYGPVLISSEGSLPLDLERFRLHGPVEDIHHLLGYASLVIGESATMSSEAAVLGTPAVYIAETGRGFTTDQEHRYGLVRSFNPMQLDEALEYTDALFGPGGRDFVEPAHRKLLEEKIDVTQWMIDFFEREFADRAP
jgi:uncharacterized protein